MLWCCLCAVLLDTAFLLPSSLGTVFLNHLGFHFTTFFMTFFIHLFSVNHHHHHQHLERSLIPWTITSDRHDGPMTATDTSTRQEEKKSCTLLLPCTFTVHYLQLQFTFFNLALFNLAHFNLTNLTNRTHVQCLVLLIVAVLVLTTTDIFCFKKKQMDQIKNKIKNKPIIKTGKK